MSPTILLVDDDRALADAYAGALTEAGMTVRIAGRVRDAVAAIEHEPVDLAVVDGLLPDGSGIDLVATLRSRAPNLRIIFLSAFFRDLASHRRLVGELKVAAVLRKPLPAGELRVHVDACLERTAVAALPPATTPVLAAEGAAAFAQLRRTYAEALPGQLQSLLALIESAAAGDAEARTQAHRAAHRLHGTAGTYGMAEVSEVAGEIERALEPGAAAVDWRDVRELLATLKVSDVSAEPVRPRTTTGPTLLVADDDPDFLRILERAAQARMLRVVTAQSPAEALDRARHERVDAALLDVQFAGGALGFELARELRRLPELEGLPIGFISSHGTLVNRVEAIHAGGSVFLSKPLDLDLFTRTAQQLIASRRRHRPRVLLVDDDRFFLETLADLLRDEGFEAKTLRDPWEFLDALEREQPDAVLVDAIMPGVSGFELCRIVRATPGWRELPVLLMTGKSDAGYRTAAFEAGADDHVPKPIVAPELLARLRGRLARARMAKERSDVDPLTGLPLRRAFIEAFSARLAWSRRTSQPLSVALIDLDRFKQVNDTYGHLAGDRVLAALGSLLGRSFREEDLRGRWGGEEFIVALTGCEAAQTRDVLERTLAELREMTFEAEDGRLFQVSFSAGVASFPADGADLQRLASAADGRLYLAKRSGRAQVRAADARVDGAPVETVVPAVNRVAAR